MEKKKNIKKIIWRKTIVSYNVFKKKNYKTKFSTSLILKKKLTNNFEKNHKKKNYVGNDCSNPQCFKEKKEYKSKFSTSSILKK
jgi:hypothetical protein